MTTHILNSETGLQKFIGELRSDWRLHKFLRVTVKTGRSRSLDQNAISHCWYEQVANELREDKPLGVKRFCKLHFGVPILRSEDEKFRGMYDKAIRLNLSYEEKLGAMDFLPVTSHMTKDQLSAYLVAMQDHYRERGVLLEFPDDQRMAA